MSDTVFMTSWSNISGGGGGRFLGRTPLCHTFLYLSAALDLMAVSTMF